MNRHGGCITASCRLCLPLIWLLCCTEDLPVSSNTCKPLYGISRYCNSVSEYIWNRSNTIIYIRLSKYFLNASSSLLLTNACCHCLKDYAVGDQLGHGQFATVRLARNKHTGSVFAIKIVSKVWLYTIINTKNCNLSIVLMAMDQKPLKSLKRWYYPPSHCLNVNVMLSNMTFLMIFAVFDPSPLTLWINCSF